MQSYYSFYGSPLHLILEDDVADAYNRRVTQWYEAQERFEETHGRKWDPSEPILIQKDDEAQDAWDKVRKIIDSMVEANGGGLDIPEDEMPEEGLIKL